MERLTQKALAAIQRHQMLKPGDGVVVGLSGGPDSVALGHILLRLRPELDLQLYLAHLHHGLRGQSAERDLALVQALAEKWQLPLTVERADVRGLAGRRKLSLEAAGREARHAFLEGTRSSVGARRIALGHHADDAIETFLINLLRGAAAGGLSGIPPVRGAIIRPLIESTRPAILAYLQAHQLPWREDPSNRDLRFLRNRIRHQLLPELEALNPGVRKVLYRTLTALFEEDQALEWAAEKILGPAAVKGAEGLSWQRERLLAAPAGLRLVWYRRQIEHWRGQALGFSQAHLLALDALVCGPRPQAEIHLPAGLRARRSYENVELVTAKPAPSSTASELELMLPVPGRVIWPLSKSQSASITAEFASEPPRFSKARPMTAGKGDPQSRLGHCHAWLDPDRLPGPVSIRRFRPGDRIQPLGLAGTRKLKDVFMELKLPSDLRKAWPVIVAGSEIVWVPGYRIARRFKLEADCRRPLRLDFHWQ
jgi:tRNA(Ile)-lysidine synthase